MWCTPATLVKDVAEAALGAGAARGTESVCELGMPTTHVGDVAGQQVRGGRDREGREETDGVDAANVRQGSARYERRESAELTTHGVARVVQRGGAGHRKGAEAAAAEHLAQGDDDWILLKYGGRGERERRWRSHGVSEREVAPHGDVMEFFGSVSWPSRSRSRRA